MFDTKQNSNIEELRITNGHSRRFSGAVLQGSRSPGLGCWSLFPLFFLEKGAGRGEELSLLGFVNRMAEALF